MNKMTKSSKLFCFLSPLIFMSCSQIVTKNIRSPGSDGSYNSPRFREDYKDDLKEGDAVVIDGKYCQWKNEPSYDTLDRFYSRVFEPSDDLPERLCFGYIVGVDYFTNAYNVHAVRGYSPELGIFSWANSFTSVQTTLEKVPRESLSIPVHGLCVVDETYCIGEDVQVKAERIVNAKITGIFRDGSLALQIKDDFTYIGKSMSGELRRKLTVPYSIRANIIDVER